jgi:hypothetical protein
MIPLCPLTDFISHKEKLFARMEIHVTIKQSQICKFLPLVPWHLSDHGSFAMDDFIMGKRQYEIFMKGIEEAEGEGIVMILPVKGILGKIKECVMHPSHIPLKSEPDPSEICRPGYHGPCGRLLGHGDDVGITLVYKSKPVDMIDFGVRNGGRPFVIYFSPPPTNSGRLP